MEKEITKEQLTKWFNQMLASIDDDSTSESNEHHVQGGTQLSLLDECGSPNTCIKANKIKRHRSK